MAAQESIERPQFVVAPETSSYTRRFLSEFEEAIFQNPEAIIALTSLPKAVAQLREQPRVDENSKRLVSIYFDAGLDQNHVFDASTESAIKDDPDQRKLVKSYRDSSLARSVRTEASNTMRRNRVAVFASRVISYKSIRSEHHLPQAG